MSRGHTVKGVAGHDDVPRESADKSARDTDPAGSFEEINEWLLTLVDEHIARIEGEEARQKFLDAIKERLPKVFCDTAGHIVESLFESAPALLAECRALDASHAAEIEESWGEALGIYRMLWVSCHETVGALSARHFNVKGYEPPAMVHAQVGLQARACRVGVEVLEALAGRPRRRRPRQGAHAARDRDDLNRPG